MCSVYRGGVRDLRAYLRSEWNLKTLSEGLPGKCQFGDIDAALERRGRFLFLEFKGLKESLNTGQRIFHENLTRLSNKITSACVWGNPNNPERINVCRGGSWSGVQAIDEKQFDDALIEWWNRASN